MSRLCVLRDEQDWYAEPRIISRRFLGNSKDPRIALAIHFCLPTHLSLCDGEEKTCSCRERLTKVVHECLRKANVAEQIRRDVTVEEMWSFAKEFDYDEAVVEEPLTEKRSHAHFNDVDMHDSPEEARRQQRLVPLIM